MLNYRNTTIACFILVPLLAIFGLLLGNQWFLVAGLFVLIVWITLLVLGSIFIQWNFYLFSYSHGDRKTPEIAITFGLTMIILTFPIGYGLGTLYGFFISAFI